MAKILTAYFSASGVTAKLAQRFVKAVNSDLFEIKPVKPYTNADLNWMDSSSRSSVEMKNKSFRPEVAEKVVNMEQYDIIFVAFPIWWYVAPTIINTFLEQYDLTGKVIVPMAKSGGSGMGKTNSELEPSCKGAVLKEGKRFAANAGEDELRKWAEQFIK